MQPKKNDSLFNSTMRWNICKILWILGNITKMNDIMKTTKSLEESGLLIKSVSETIESESKEQKGGLLVRY